MAAGCDDALTYVWNLEEKKLAATLKDQSLPVISVSFAANAKSLYLATSSLDKTIQVWDATTWKPLRSKTTVEGPVNRCFIRRVQQTPNRVQFTFGLVTAGHDNRTLQYRLDDQAPGSAGSRDFKVDIDAGLPLDCVWVKPENPSLRNLFQVYVAASDNSVQVYTQADKSFTLRTRLRGHSDWVYAVAASPDEKIVASASGDGSVKLWSAAGRQPPGHARAASPGSDDWLIVSGQGYFATSNPAAMQWKPSGLKSAAEKLAALQNPEKVRQVLAGKKLPPPMLK